MDLNAFICSFCSSVCPFDCFPTHSDIFICHNTVCFAHKSSPLRQHSISTATVSLLPNGTDYTGCRNTRDIFSECSLSQEEARKEYNEESATNSRTKSQEHKLLDLINTLQDAPYPTALDYLFDISMVPSISEIVPGLFIGNMACVDHESVLRRYNITAVISIVSPKRLPFPESQIPREKPGLHPIKKLFIKDRMVIAAYDRRSEDLIQHFEGTCSFIYRQRHPATSAAVAGPFADARSDQERFHFPTHSTRKEENPRSGRVLVHCTQGISRSATIVAAYLMWRKQETAAKILAFIKNKRPKVNPNEGFLDQLLVWQDVHYNIWDSKYFRVPCNEYCELQGRLRDYKHLEELKKAARRGL